MSLTRLSFSFSLSPCDQLSLFPSPLSLGPTTTTTISAVTITSSSITAVQPSEEHRHHHLATTMLLAAATAATLLPLCSSTVPSPSIVTCSATSHRPTTMAGHPRRPIAHLHQSAIVRRSPTTTLTVHSLLSSRHHHITTLPPHRDHHHLPVITSHHHLLAVSHRCRHLPLWLPEQLLLTMAVVAATLLGFLLSLKSK